MVNLNRLRNSNNVDSKATSSLHRFLFSPVYTSQMIRISSPFPEECLITTDHWYRDINLALLCGWLPCCKSSSPRVWVSYHVTTTSPKRPAEMETRVPGTCQPSTWGPRCSAGRITSISDDGLRTHKQDILLLFHFPLQSFGFCILSTDQNIVSVV